MAKVRVRKETGQLFFDFQYRKKRCREYTTLPDTPANRRKMEQVLKRIKAETTLGTFCYRDYFPNSPMAFFFDDIPQAANDPSGALPLFNEVSDAWYEENSVTWKRSYRKTVKTNISRFLVPAFGTRYVNEISKADIKQFRASLLKPYGKGHKQRSTDRVNHILTTLRQILTDASDTYGFVNPYQGIKPLKVPPVVIEPFSLKEVWKIINSVRLDFRNYYTVRFFTGMRTGEIDGLLWEYVDLSRREIHVQSTIVDGDPEIPKCIPSYRVIQMSGPVYEALMAQYEVTGKGGGYVFCNRVGNPLDHRNVTKRVWYPLLKLLDLKKRKPYQTRHTAATLWLAAGENPEWIARQLGHANTRMLFERYSRYVPNLTRQDGSAMDRLLQQCQQTQQESDGDSND